MLMTPHSISPRRTSELALPSLPVATTPIYGDNDAAFMRLFRFIDRDNVSGDKIAMTTPVFFDGNPDPKKE